MKLSLLFDISKEIPDEKRVFKVKITGNEVNIAQRIEVIVEHFKATVMDELGETILPQFGQIWKLISVLNYQDRPDYEKIDELLCKKFNFIE